jgi:hypothetical protein
LRGITKQKGMAFAMVAHSRRALHITLREPTCRRHFTLGEGVNNYRGANIAAVALANRLSRITWAVLAKNECFRWN